MIKILYKNIRIEKLNLITLFTVAALLLVYLFEVNSVSVANYKKILLIKNIEELRMEIRSLNLELIGKRSIGFLKKSASSLNLVVNDNVQYIKVVGQVAKNP